MSLDQFTRPDKVTGFSTTPVTQKKTDTRTYYDLQIPKMTEKSQKLENNDLLEILIRNHKGNTTFFKRKTSKRSGGLKIYLPADVVDELELDEDSIVDVFISKD